MLTPREKSHLPEKFSSVEDRTHGAVSSMTASPTHYQQAILAPVIFTLLIYIYKIAFVGTGVYIIHRSVWVLNVTVPVPFMF